MTYFCIECAAAHGSRRVPPVVAEARFLDAGFSLCAHHIGSVEQTIALPGPTSCRVCGAGSHAAWFVIEGVPLCIRHGADAWFPDDDMGAHDLAHGLYQQLNTAGIRDAY